MSKGYFAIVQNNSDTDYLSQAYQLALSLKSTQSTINNLSIMVDEPTKKLITGKHRRVFDHIVDIPWEDDASQAEWKVNNKWKIYYATPYDETVLLDTDMVFPCDVSHWWPILAQQDFWATTNVKTYRGEDVDSDYYRKTFTENNLPNIYNAFMYFKKSEVSSEIFKMAEIIFHNWQRFYHLYLKSGTRPKHVSGDVVFALAINILGYEHLATRKNLPDIPTFVHMKSELQGVTGMPTDWSQRLDTIWSSPDNLVIGNFKQQYPFHYVNKEWISQTENILEQE